MNKSNLIKLVISVLSIASCKNEIREKSTYIISKEVNKNLQNSKYIVENEICFLDIGNIILKDELIGKYNLTYSYLIENNCYKKCSLIETKEGLDFLDSNSYEFLTLNIDSTIDIGKGKYNLNKDTLILTFYEKEKLISDKFKITGKSDTIYFQKLDSKKGSLIYEYIKIKE